MDRFDLVLVGGGLQNGLIALAVRARWPHARIAMVERGERPGGNHTWCFHSADVSPASADWVAPLVCRRWPGYDVRFAGLRRTVEEPYAAITSERFAEVVSASVRSADGSQLLLGSDAVEIGATRVRLADGRELEAGIVIDARGPDRFITTGTGFQKFLGLEVRVDPPHGLLRPVLMDATVDQDEGFRFFYLLPMAEDRLLIEDTYFNRSSELDVERLRKRIDGYAMEQGYNVTGIVREERGVLPMPWKPAPRHSGEALRAGYAGGWFHPGTGYSFPVAARLAETIAGAEPGRKRAVARRLESLARTHRRQSAFCHFLNRLLFRHYAPSSRCNVFERFYRLPRKTIRRFYALEMSIGDRLRLVGGTPPRGFSLRGATGGSV